MSGSASGMRSDISGTSGSELHPARVAPFGMIAEPVDGRAETLLEARPGLPAKEAAGLRGIRLERQDLAPARSQARGVLDRPGIAGAREPLRELEQLADRFAAPGPELDDLAVDVRGGRGTNEAVDRVGDEREVAPRIEAPE